MSKVMSAVLAATLGLLMTSPAFAASGMHVRVQSHGFTTASHGGSTYHVSPGAHGYMVSRQTAHGWSSVHVSYQHPGGHGYILARAGCVVYIDNNYGVWTGYYYYVC